MSYIEVKNINETKTAFNVVFNEALKSKVIICQNAKSTNEEMVSIIGTVALKEILSKYTFRPIYHIDQETGLHEVRVDEVSQFAYADTKEEAEEQLMDLIEDYVKDYLSRMELFRQVEDYKVHYPYILRLAHCKDREEMREVIFHGDM